MKVLIVSQYFWPENFRINDLAAKLVQNGHEITVLTGVPNYPSGIVDREYKRWKNRKQNFEGIEILRVPLFARRQSKGYQLILNYVSFVISACLLGPILLRKKHFDMVFVPSYSPATVSIPGLLLKWVKRAPMIIWMQDLWPQSLSATGAIKSPTALAVVGSMMAWIYRRSDLIMVQSRAFYPSILELKASKQKLRYLPNWAEQEYRPVKVSPNLRDQIGFPTNGFNIVFAGNLGAAQSLGTILEAADLSRQHPINWIIIGSGRNSAMMCEQANRTNLSECVHFLGRKQLHEMPAYFALADALLVTLRPDPILNTTIPGKIQSYLACGRPILGALDGEGATIILESQSGYSVPAGDAEALSEAAIRMSVLTESERQTLGQNALQYYQEWFDGNKLVKVLEKEMDALLEARK